MNYYLKHLSSLYTRPILNGIDGNMELRAASPFELFLDLIFVIALSKLSYLFELQTIYGFLEATLLFAIIYSLWHTVTTYTVMFMKKETNYWTRAMIFLVMLPLIFFISIQSFETHVQVMIFCLSLAISKILLALILRDSIINAPLNNILTSNLYLSISKTQLISSILLIIAAFIDNNLLFAILLVIIAVREVILVPHIHKKTIRQSFSPLLLNKQLFMERQLLFIILIFGESLISVVNNIASNPTPLSVLYIILVFSIMFLFYVRISEETEYNTELIDRSNNLSYWMIMNYIIFTIFAVISMVPELIEHHHHLPISYLVILLAIMLFIATEHLRLNLKRLNKLSRPIDKVFYKVDNRMIFLMYVVCGLLLIFHNSVLVIYILLLIYFLLHVIALPFRSHLIDEDCYFATYLNNKSDRDIK